MAKWYVSLPRPFSSGDVKDWFQQFDICIRANGWDVETEVKKLLPSWRGSSCGLARTNLWATQKTMMKQKLMEKTIMPMTFVRRVSPQEALTWWGYLPVCTWTKEIAYSCSFGFGANSERVIFTASVFGGNSRGHLQIVKSFGQGNYFECSDYTSETVDEIDSEPIAVLTIKPDEVQLLWEQVADLTEQVATLSTSSKGTQPTRSPPHCFHVIK